MLNQIKIDYRIFLGVGFTVALICAVVIIQIIRKRKLQPLRKKSPLLMILSVIGNFCVMFNITTCCIYFELVTEAQAKCYFPDQKYEPDAGKLCFEDWIMHYKAFGHFSEYNAICLVTLSEAMAFLPYLLRSLRI